MLWRVCKGYTIVTYAELDESLEDPETVSKRPDHLLTAADPQPAGGAEQSAGTLYRGPTFQGSECHPPFRAPGLDPSSLRRPCASKWNLLLLTAALTDPLSVSDSSTVPV